MRPRLSERRIGLYWDHVNGHGVDCIDWFVYNDIYGLYCEAAD